MSGRKTSRVIFDMNIWISFLIGKRLQFIKELIANRQLVIILSEQLLLELKIVTQRPKLQKYFPEEKVKELIQFLETIGKMYVPKSNNRLSRDPKDNFLLDLARCQKLTFL